MANNTNKDIGCGGCGFYIVYFAMGFVLSNWLIGFDLSVLAGVDAAEKWNSTHWLIKAGIMLVGSGVILPLSALLFILSMVFPTPFF